jgi:hypothetical protein
VLRHFALSAALVAALISSPALAQRGPDRFTITPGERAVERDVQGRRTGSFERESSGRIVERDALGRRTGTVERGSGDQLIRRDAMGRRTGTIERGR